ncbi:MAG: sugar phosphate isomerase/epimerase [Clostridia bacterium]|nr:sugar phosphate isomerase/epimerase [Clostridia bacterium]
MKLVTQTEVLSERFNSDAEAVRIICESGFDGIDFSMFKMQDDGDVLNGAGYKEHVANLKKIAAFYGVTFEQAHAPFPSAKEKNAEYTAVIFEKLKRALEIAGLLDAKICVVHPVQFSSNQFERNMELYHALEPYAADSGVKIALENMWGWDNVQNKIVPNVCSLAPEFNRYVDALNTDNFTACLDLGHCGLVGGDAASMIREMGSRLGCLHIHDNDHFDDSHTLPYLSEMDWDSILKALGEIDYKGNFTYEADKFLHGFPTDLLPACERFMHDIGRGMMKKIESYRVAK